MLRRGLVLDLSVAFGMPCTPSDSAIGPLTQQFHKYNSQDQRPLMRFFLGLGTSFGYLWWYGTWTNLRERLLRDLRTTHLLRRELGLPILTRNERLPRPIRPQKRYFLRQAGGSESQCIQPAIEHCDGEEYLRRKKGMEWNGSAIMENHATNSTAHERQTCGSGCTYPTIGAGMEVIAEVIYWISCFFFHGIRLHPRRRVLIFTPARHQSSLPRL